MPEILSELNIRLDPTPTPEILLPKGWTALTLQSILHVISLARITVLNAAVWPNDRECDGLRLRVENDRLRAEVNLLKMKLAIKGARIARLDPKKRSHYLPGERLEILMIRAVRGRTNGQVAKRFHVTVAIAPQTALLPDCFYLGQWRCYQSGRRIEFFVHRPPTPSYARCPLHSKEVRQQAAISALGPHTTIAHVASEIGYSLETIHR